MCTYLGEEIVNDQGFIIGVVIGIDEESACCWLACDICGNAEIKVKQETRYLLISKTSISSLKHVNSLLSVVYCYVQMNLATLTLDFVVFYSSQFFCSSCNVPVDSPQTKTFLAVLLKVKRFPEASVRVTVRSLGCDVQWSFINALSVSS